MSTDLLKGDYIVDEPWKVEQNELDPIPLHKRHGNPWELLGMWFGGNVNYQVITTGLLLGTLGLGLWDCVTAIIIGNLLGCAILGLASIPGPRTGNAGIVTSRASFGQKGSYLPKVISLFAIIGWFCISTMIGILALEELFITFGVAESVGLKIFCAILVAVIEVLIALYGHASIVKYETAMSFLLGVLFIGMFLFMLPKINWAFAGDPAADRFQMWIVAVGIAFSYPLSWTNFAGDYSRYLPYNSNWKTIAWSAGMGQFFALVFCEILGVLAIIAVGGHADNPITDLPKIMPVWYLVPFLLSVTIGCIATDVLNAYSAGLGLLALRVPVKRVISVGIIGVIAVIFRIYAIYFVDFFAMYQQWLTFIIIWTCPWVSIVIVDHYLRHGNYNMVDLVNASGGEYWFDKGIHWPGVVSFIVGLAAGILTTNTPFFVSPLMAPLGHIDLSYFVGVLLTAVLYYYWAKSNPGYAVAQKGYYSA